MPLVRSGGEWTGSTINGTIKAVLSDGSLLAVWVKPGAEGSKELVGQVYSSGGTPTGSPFVMKSFGTGSMQNVSATALANGRFAITWIHNTDDFGNYRLETGIFNSNGSVFKAPEQIGSNLASSAEVSTLANGGYVMTYYERGVKTVTYDANGVPGPTFTISPNIDHETAAIKAGGYVTVVAETNSTGTNSTIRVYLRKPDGQLTEAVVATTEENVQDLKVIGLTNGNFAVVWNEENPSGPDHIKAQIANAQGALVGGQVTLYEHAAAYFQSVTVQALLDGGFALAFVQAEPQQDVYLGTYSDAGAVVTAPVLVNQQTEGFQGAPSLNILKDGRILVRWYDYQENLGHYQAFDTGDGVPPVADPVSSLGLTLRGTRGKDVLVGGTGDDKFYGDYGNDKLTGMSGADVFVFSAKLGTSKTDRKVNFDTITDFNVADDTLWLDNKVFKKLGKNGSELNPGKLNKKFFKVADKAKDKDDYLVYNKKTGILSYDADGSGSGKAIEIAKLAKNLKLTAADFLVI